MSVQDISFDSLFFDILKKQIYFIIFWLEISIKDDFFLFRQRFRGRKYITSQLPNYPIT